MNARLLAFAFVTFLVGPTAARTHAPHDHVSGQIAFRPEAQTNNASDDGPLPESTRAHWMRVANSANSAISACPFAPFGTAVVNHSSPSSDPSRLGTLVCTGVNHNGRTGNPTLHGEMAAFANCGAALTDPARRWGLSSAEALEAWKGLSLYTTAEPCPMCAAAVAWAGVKEVVFAVGIEELIELGWSQIEIGSQEVMDRAWRLGRETSVIGGVLGGEMRDGFAWQFGGGECPEGCGRREGRCVPDRQGGQVGGQTEVP